MELAHFGKFMLDPVSRLLLFDGSAVAVEPKVFDCIELLVSQAGELVTMEHLRRALWPDVACWRRRTQAHHRPGAQGAGGSRLTRKR